jgi:hypothetical protein
MNRTYRVDSLVEVLVQCSTLVRVWVHRRPGAQADVTVAQPPTGRRLDQGRIFAALLRRFDLEHTFRLFKQTLGWTRPRLRTPAQTDRWTWLIIAAYTHAAPGPRGLAGDGGSCGLFVTEHKLYFVSIPIGKCRRYSAAIR